MKRNIHYLFFILACVAALPACATLEGFPLTYSAEAIEGWVIDAETKQPLEGVIVTANWQLESAYTPGQMEVFETVTDRDGRFYFPAWGPKRRPLNAILTNEDPQIVMFKTGYDFVRLTNTAKSYYNKESVRRSEWNGRTVKLSRAKNNIIQDGPFVTSEYAKQLTFINSAVGWAYREECELKKIPRMALALHRQKQEFKARNLENGLPSLDFIVDARYHDPCGLRAVLGEELRR